MTHSPSLVLIVDDRVDTVANCQREQSRPQVLERHPVKLFGSRLLIGSFVLELQPWQKPKDRGVLGVDSDVDDLVNLPYLNDEAHEAADLDDGVGLVVKDVEQNDERLEHVEEHGANRETLQGLPVVPKLDVCNNRFLLEKN